MQKSPMTYPTSPDNSIQPQASPDTPTGKGFPVTTPKSTNENINASAILKTFNVRLPNRLLPNSLSNAVAVHENATPIEISSPKYVIV